MARIVSLAALVIILLIIGGLFFQVMPIFSSRCFSPFYWS